MLLGSTFGNHGAICSTDAKRSSTSFQPDDRKSKSSPMRDAISSLTVSAALYGLICRPKFIRRRLNQALNGLVAMYRGGDETHKSSVARGSLQQSKFAPGARLRHSVKGSRRLKDRSLCPGEQYGLQTFLAGWKHMVHRLIAKFTIDEIFPD